MKGFSCGVVLVRYVVHLCSMVTHGWIETRAYVLGNWDSLLYQGPASWSHADPEKVSSLEHEARRKGAGVEKGRKETPQGSQESNKNMAPFLFRTKRQQEDYLPMAGLKEHTHTHTCTPLSTHRTVSTCTRTYTHTHTDAHRNMSRSCLCLW